MRASRIFPAVLPLLLALLLAPLSCHAAPRAAFVLLHPIEGSADPSPSSPTPTSPLFPRLSLARSFKAQVVEGHHANDPTQCASGFYDDLVNSTGWGELTVQASAACAPEQAAFAMGVLEGHFTWLRIWQAFQNFNASNGWLAGGQLPARLADFVSGQTEWMQDMVLSQSGDPYWQHVHMLLQQAAGVAQGYAATAPAPFTLTSTQVYILTLAGDLEDLARAFAAVPAPRPGSHMDCSALVKLDPAYADLYVGHTTFNAYWCMLRVFKHYIFDVPPLAVAASTVSFSSRPGDLESKDDFFLMSSGLVVVETSLTVFNTSLYKALTPHSVPVWLRVQLANRMAADAPAWVQLFSRYNSGTHNNEWIVVDYNKFTPHLPPASDMVWLVDQLPGYIASMDATPMLLEQLYIPSYNIPFFPEVMDMSGYAQAGYSYVNDTRARIFRRDHATVHDLDGMCTLMNSNNYRTDPLAGGNPCNQISARCDLAGEAFGGIDSKNVDLASVRAMRVKAIGAPTHDVQPVFVFSNGYESVPHMGVPDRLDFNWTIMTPRLQLGP